MARYTGDDPVELLLYYLELAGAPTGGDCAIDLVERHRGRHRRKAVQRAREEMREEMREVCVDGLIALIGERLGDQKC